MSQPHPPIPEPQQQPQDTPDDDPRTQSILLPPSQRPAAEQPAPAQPTPAAPAAPAEERPAPGAAHFVPGFGGAPEGSTGSHAVPSTGNTQPAAAPTGPPPPVPGPMTTPGSPFGVGPAGPPPVPPSPAPGPGPSPSAHQSAGHAGPPAARHSAFAAVRSAGRGRGLLAGLALGVAGLAMLEVGLVLGFGSESLWDVVPTWSAFATVAALVALVPVLARLTGRPSARTAWRAGAVGAAGVAAFWVLIGLPLVASDRGFWLAAAAAAIGAAVWLSPGRTE